MWAEWVNAGNDRLAHLAAHLPRVAERLWSPRTVADVGDMYRRMAILSLQLEELGLMHKEEPGHDAASSCAR
jgi:hexosaminidase